MAVQELVASSKRMEPAFWLPVNHSRHNSEGSCSTACMPMMMALWIQARRSRRVFSAPRSTDAAGLYGVLSAFQRAP